MKKYLNRFTMLAILLGIVVIIVPLFLLLSDKQANVNLVSETLDENRESITEQAEIVLQQDRKNLNNTDEHKHKKHTNVASYLCNELVWEMGDQKPKPIDFFQEELIDAVDGLSKDAIDQFILVTPLTDKMLYTKGKYIIKMDCNGIIVDARLSVVDTTPPVIIVPEYMEYEIGETILYKKNVVITDNSGESLKLMLDSSEVKSNIAGTYKVYYSAVDSSGNKGTAETVIIIKQGHQPTKEEVDVLVDALLSSILTEDMTQFDQAKAIFEWCYSNIRYAADSDKSSLVQGAYDGIYYHTGDCYTYFATAAYMLNRCNIENLSVSRKSEDATHYWSLVNLGNGWYHFDSSPHKSGYKCFMQTDAQVKEYAKKNERQKDYFTFDESDMPNRAENVIYSNYNLSES